jgi:hypothetical protein
MARKSKQQKPVVADDAEVVVAEPVADIVLAPSESSSDDDDEAKADQQPVVAPVKAPKKKSAKKVAVSSSDETAVVPEIPSIGSIIEALEIGKNADIKKAIDLLRVIEQHAVITPAEKKKKRALNAFQKFTARTMNELVAEGHVGGKSLMKDAVALYREGKEQGKTLNADGFWA